MMSYRRLLPPAQELFRPTRTKTLLASVAILSIRNASHISALLVETSQTSLHFSTSKNQGGGSHSTISTSCGMSNLKSDPNDKSVDDLRVQWAGGRDVWPRVPIETQEGQDFISIQTKVKDNNSESVDLKANKPEWPRIVKESTLYGFGAYNPRGQELEVEVNEKQHALLHKDIQNALSHYPKSVATYWEGASIWEDDSFEKGFILAFRDKKKDGLELSIELARKYKQGAIYQFQIEDGENLIRDTVAVLDEGSDARVEVEIDDSGIDLPPFKFANRICEQNKSH